MHHLRKVPLYARIQKVLSEWVQHKQRFFSLMGEELSKYHYQRAIFGPPANRHSNGVSLAYRLWPKIESWLGSLTILRGSGPVLLKNLYFCDFRGGPDPLSPLWIRLCTTSSWLMSCWFSSPHSITSGHTCVG